MKCAPSILLAAMATAATGQLTTSPASRDPAKVQADSYKVDPNHTQVLFTVSHMGFSEYSGRFTGVDGTLLIDPKRVAATQLNITIPVASVSTTSQQLDGELKSDQWLDATRFNQMRFRSTRVTSTGPGRARIDGELTLHGETRPVTLQARFVGAGVNPLDKAYTVGFRATGTLQPFCLRREDLRALDRRRGDADARRRLREDDLTRRHWRPTMRQPTFFISHGGGPYFWIDLPPPFERGEIDRMRSHLAGLLDGLPSRPAAILLVSAHWEEPVPTLKASPAPGMLFDYGGFPEHTYRLDYPAPGDPALADRVEALLTDAGIASALDRERRFDHGVFVPMLIVDPTATLPVVSMSLQHDLDPALHLAVGRALEPLRDDDVLIVGSGNSFNNIRAIYDGRGNADASAFDAWLTKAVEQPDPVRRSDLLAAWSTAPHARYAQPREDHLLPLMVAAGAGGRDRGRRAFLDTIAGKACSAYRFG